MLSSFSKIEIPGWYTLPSLRLANRETALGISYTSLIPSPNMLLSRHDASTESLPEGFPCFANSWYHGPRFVLVSLGRIHCYSILYLGNQLHVVLCLHDILSICWHERHCGPLTILVAAQVYRRLYPYVLVSQMVQCCEATISFSSDQTLLLLGSVILWVEHVLQH